MISFFSVLDTISIDINCPICKDEIKGEDVEQGDLGKTNEIGHKAILFFFIFYVNNY